MDWLLQARVQSVLKQQNVQLRHKKLKFLTKNDFRSLYAKSIQTSLDEEVEDLLLHIADDFIEQTVMASCALAKHRKANSVDVKDVQLVLERNWNMWIPGFGTEDVRPYRKSATTEAHKARMALIRKALKKY